MSKDRFSKYLQAVCDEYGLTKEQLFEKSRNRYLVEARRSLIHMCYKHCQKAKLPHAYIAQFFDQNDFNLGPNLYYHIKKFEDIDENDITKDVLSERNLSAS